MKSPTSRIVILISLFLVLFLVPMIPPAVGAAEPTSMSVTVRETQVRSSPGFMGALLGTLSYGDRVEVKESRSGWARVVLPGTTKEGWVHLSALTEKRIALSAGASGAGTTASSGEVALAGKGFNKQVEEQYKSEKQLDYTWVDRMEGYGLPTERLVSFLGTGGVEIREGGTK